MPPYFLGIDAGGTKTLALLADSSGTVIGSGEAGPGNYQTVGAEAAFSALEAAAAAAWQSAGLPAQPLDAVCLGLAGVDRPDDRALVTAWASRAFPGAKVIIANDAMLVLAAGTPHGAGIAVISGTGSIVYAANGQGRAARSGGWGYLLGDEGSGYAVGLAALRAVARAADRRAPATLLTGLVLDHFGLDTPTGLIRRVYREDLPRAEIAALAALVDAAAEQADPTALEILAQAGDELALAAQTAARALDLPAPIPCALAGGAIIKGKHLQAAFRRAAERSGLDLDPITPVPVPGVGAVKMARKA